VLWWRLCRQLLTGDRAGDPVTVARRLGSVLAALPDVLGSEPLTREDLVDAVIEATGHASLRGPRPQCSPGGSTSGLRWPRRRLSLVEVEVEGSLGSQGSRGSLAAEHLDEMTAGSTKGDPVVVVLVPAFDPYVVAGTWVGWPPSVRPATRRTCPAPRAGSRRR
jgi:hypothetical protein